MTSPSTGLPSRSWLPNQPEVDTGCLIRRPPQDGQNPRPRQLKATTVVSPHRSQRTRRKPWSRNPLSNCRNTPIEAIEQVDDYLLVRRYALLPDSGGAGRWRGGLGFCREVEVLEGGVELTIYSDHFKLAPPGRQGGRPGRTGSLTVFRGGERIELSAKTTHPLAPGDVVRLELGGGGGYGDPRERSRELVERDLADGRITAAHAAAVYGYRAAGAVDATPGPPAGTYRRSSPRPP